MHYSIIERRCHGSELPSNLISCQGVQELFEFEVMATVDMSIQIEFQIKKILLCMKLISNETSINLYHSMLLEGGSVSNSLRSSAPAEKDLLAFIAAARIEGSEW